MQQPDTAIETAATSNSEQALVEVGWLLDGQLDNIDRRAVDSACRRLCEKLEQWLPQFQWRMPLVVREAADDGPRQEPAQLLSSGVELRNTRHWDYTVVVTAADLVSHYKPLAVACVSRSLEGVVVSTRRLDPKSEDAEAGESKREETIAGRLLAIVLHALGHHGGLPHCGEADNFMAQFATVADIDLAAEFRPEQLDVLSRQFGEVADQRLEETTIYRNAGALPFYVRGAWMNRREIGAAVLQARPWQFPYRLSRLTTAAISATLVLFLTAEAWELATHQSPALLAGLSVAAVLATTVYVLMRQHLLLGSRRATLSEQTVVTNISAVAIVLGGIVTTYVCLLSVATAVGWLLFSGEVMRSWANVESASWWLSPLKPAALATSLAMFIGALGASFENTAYIRHVTFVDEEI